jgi:hypothetical protein
MIDDECLPSYLLRLTLRNGFGSTNNWLNSHTLHAATTGHLSTRQTDELFSKVGVVATSNHCLFSGNLSPLFLSPTSLQPRICPECIKEFGYIKSEWMNLNNLVCLKHNCLLVDYCRHCQQQLQWSISLLTNKCSNPDCNESIKLSSFETLPSNLTIQQISDCLVAQFFYNKVDVTILPKLKNFEMNHFNNQLMMGYRLLNDKKTFEKWLALLNLKSLQHREFPEDIRLYPWQLLTKSIQCNWPNLNRTTDVKFESTSSKAPTYPIPLKIPAEQLMRSLGISTFQLRDVLSLIDQSYLSNKRVSPKRQIDMVALSSKLINNSTSIRKGRTISEVTSDNSDKLKELYIAIMSNTISFNYSPKQNYKTSITIS